MFPMLSVTGNLKTNVRLKVLHIGTSYLTAILIRVNIIIALNGNLFIFAKKVKLISKIFVIYGKRYFCLFLFIEIMPGNN